MMKILNKIENLKEYFADTQSFYEYQNKALVMKCYF